MKEGKNTLQGGPNCCYIVLFFRGPMFELQLCHYYEGISLLFLHIMVGQNPNKSNSKEITFLNLIWCDVKVYLCQKIYTSHHIKKCTNIQKMIEMIFSLYEICNIY
jgi:hypothetical protein